MITDYLPAVLTFKPPQSSISIYRALKNARELIEKLEPENPSDADRIQVALDDLELMMRVVR